MKITKFAIPGLLILLLSNAGCSKNDENDIRGQWSFTSGSEELYVLAFSGTEEGGTLLYVDYPNGGAGTYTVTGETVVFDFISTMAGGKSCHFSGSFESEDKLSGTMDLTAAYPPFAWTKEVEGQRL